MKTNLRGRRANLKIAYAMNGINGLIKTTQAIANDKRRVTIEGGEIAFPLIGMTIGVTRCIENIQWVTDEEGERYPALIFNKSGFQRPIISLFQLATDDENLITLSDNTVHQMKLLTGKQWATLIGVRVLAIPVKNIGTHTKNPAIHLKVV